MADEPNHVHLTDPRAMRALAHPTRLRLLGELRLRGPQTVGMLSERVGEAVGSVSWHVGKLAEHGFVTEAPDLARNRRERWWRAAHATTDWDPVELLDDPEQQLAGTLLRRAAMERYVARYQAYLESEASLDLAWVRGTTSSDTVLHLTPDELGELRDELSELGRRWHRRGAAGRPGAEMVTLIWQAYRGPQ
ncbi:helix-turn-helix domain-containing protein [Micromonospora sp. WMMD998]|uniref:helix-turn-helix domain-containing protein n=1 Tax=Micromonospora sp. WMMD998 TaxID=3016092 RepID=UPI00249B07F9|nr:helix-turn-helix domain-containing protein [Micromonospora sp. WMMD998]WFE40498.1 helix-turn-helix domain-containing protein [Micromonospora sp. WMMD998]